MSAIYTLLFGQYVGSLLIIVCAICRQSTHALLYGQYVGNLHIFVWAMCRQSTDYSFGNVSAIYRLLFRQCAGNIHIVWAMCRQSTGYFFGNVSAIYTLLGNVSAIYRLLFGQYVGSLHIIVLAMCRQSTHYCLGNVSAITCCFWWWQYVGSQFINVCWVWQNLAVYILLLVVAICRQIHIAVNGDSISAVMDGWWWKYVVDSGNMTTIRTLYKWWEYIGNPHIVVGGSNMSESYTLLFVVAAICRLSHTTC